jgi:hypothetical protein
MMAVAASKAKAEPGQQRTLMQAARQRFNPKEMRQAGTAF